MNDEQSQNMLPVGTVLRERYRIDRYLASGGFGNTYQATDVHLEEPVAIKEFFMRSISHRDEQSLEVSVSNSANRGNFDSQLRKFRVEAKRVFKLKNEHIVRVHDLFDAFGTSYYVMDYIDGESLSARLKRRGAPFDEGDVLGFLDQMLDALATTHRQHIWHLDIKPGNMMLTSDGTLKLIDFGASKIIDQSGERSTSSQMAYTPGYAPIEQMDQLIDSIGAHTDLYALGASLYNLLTCQNPPRGSLLNDIGDEAFQFGDNVSPQMRRLISYMMQPVRRNRPQSVADVRRFIAANHLEPPVAPEDDDEVVLVSVEATKLPPAQDSQPPKGGAIPSQPHVSQPPVSQHTVSNPPVSQPPISQPPVSRPPVSQPPVKQSNGSKRRLAIGIGAAAAVAVIAGIGFGVANMGDKSEPAPAAIVDTIATTPSTTAAPVTETPADTVSTQPQSNKKKVTKKKSSTQTTRRKKVSPDDL